MANPDDIGLTPRPSFADAHVLVTGGAGFIGGHLAAALTKAGARVAVADEMAPSSARIAAGRQAQMQVRKLSVGTGRFRRFLEQEGPFDYIFHLAARPYAVGSVATPYLDFTANLLATVQLLEQLRAAGSKSKLVFASSAAVYGNPAKLPIEEGDPTVPISPYGVSKLAAERYLAVYARLYGLPGASVRMFSVYGPGQNKQVVYDLLVKLRGSAQRLEVQGDGTQVRDLVYVDDAAHAFMVVAARGRTDGFAYNVASGSGTSTAELAQLIVEVQRANAVISFTGTRRPGDPEKWIGGNAELSSLGWAPDYSVRNGLMATARWFNETCGDVATAGVSAR